MKVQYSTYLYIYIFIYIILSFKLSSVTSHGTRTSAQQSHTLQIQWETMAILGGMTAERWAHVGRPQAHEQCMSHPSAATNSCSRCSLRADVTAIVCYTRQLTLVGPTLLSAMSQSAMEIPRNSTDCDAASLLIGETRIANDNPMPVSPLAASLSVEGALLLQPLLQLLLVMACNALPAKEVRVNEIQLSPATRIGSMLVPLTKWPLTDSPMQEFVSSCNASSFSQLQPLDKSRPVDKD